MNTNHVRTEFEPPVWAGLILKNADGSMWLIQIDRPESDVVITAETDDYSMTDFLYRPPITARVTAEVHMRGTVPTYEYRYGPDPDWVKVTPEIEQGAPEIQALKSAVLAPAAPAAGQSDPGARCPDCAYVRTNGGASPARWAGCMEHYTITGQPRAAALAPADADAGQV